MENRFVVGGEYSETTFDSMRRFSNGSAATAAALRVSALQPNVGFYNLNPALATGAGNRTDTNTDVRVSSLFVEDALKITPNLTLVGGLRHDRTKVERRIDDLNAVTTSSFDTNYKSTSGRIGAVYNLSAQTSVYGQYSNATLPVGSLFLLSAGNASFPLSRGKQAEIGLKQSIPDARVEWTLAAYDIKLDNVLSRDANNAALTVNNGNQSSRGVELSAAWRATREFTLAGNVSALQARFDTLVEAGGVSRVGNRPPNVPERVANLFATYRPEGTMLEWFMGLNRTSFMFADNAK